MFFSHLPAWDRGHLAAVSFSPFNVRFLRNVWSRKLNLAMSRSSVMCGLHQIEGVSCNPVKLTKVDKRILRLSTVCLRKMTHIGLAKDGI